MGLFGCSFNICSEKNRKDSILDTFTVTQTLQRWQNGRTVSDHTVTMPSDSLCIFVIALMMKTYYSMLIANMKQAHALFLKCEKQRTTRFFFPSWLHPSGMLLFCNKIQSFRAHLDSTYDWNLVVPWYAMKHCVNVLSEMLTRGPTFPWRRWYNANIVMSSATYAYLSSTY